MSANILDSRCSTICLEMLQRRKHETGFRENESCKAMVILTNDEGKLIRILGTDVDDMMWAATEEAKDKVHLIHGVFNCVKVVEGEFMSCR